MKLLLKQRQRIWHNAGEIVEVSPAEANFLLSVNAAEVIQAMRETPEATAAVKKETRRKK